MKLGSGMRLRLSTIAAFASVALFAAAVPARADDTTAATRAVSAKRTTTLVRHRRRRSGAAQPHEFFQRLSVFARRAARPRCPWPRPGRQNARVRAVLRQCEQRSDAPRRARHDRHRIRFPDLGYLGAQRRSRTGPSDAARRRSAEGEPVALGVDPLLRPPAPALLALVQDEAVAFGVGSERHETDRRLFDLLAEVHAARA